MTTSPAPPRVGFFGCWTSVCGGAVGLCCTGRGCCCGAPRSLSSPTPLEFQAGEGIVGEGNALTAASTDGRISTGGARSSLPGASDCRVCVEIGRTASAAMLGVCTEITVVGTQAGSAGTVAAGEPVFFFLPCETAACSGAADAAARDAGAECLAGGDASSLSVERCRSSP